MGSITFWDTKLGDADCTPLTQWPLEVLELIACELTDRAMEKIGKIHSLNHLNFQGNKVISDDGIRHLANLKELNLLRLDSTGITDASCDVIAGFSKLTMLWVNDTKMTEAGVQKLQAALPNCKITSDFPNSKPPARLITPP